MADKKKIYENFKPVLKTISYYSDFIPPLSDEKFKALKADIKEAGIIYDPIIIDENGIILDGHHRYRIAEELDISYKTEIHKEENKDLARLWIGRHQKNRREMSKSQWSVVALATLPYFSKICKTKQSEAGKKKQKSSDKPMVATDMARKEFNVNALMMKNIKSINDHIPEFTPFIRSGEYTVKDGKYLQGDCPEGSIVDDSGKLTDIAKIMLADYNKPKLPPKEEDKVVLETHYLRSSVREMKLIRGFSETNPLDVTKRMCRAFSNDAEGLCNAYTYMGAYIDSTKKIGC